MAMMNQNTPGIDQSGVGERAQFAKYSGWPELKESFMTRNIQAAYMLAPMAMDLADKGIPLKIVALGHRSGAVIMVKKDSPIKSFGDLKGKRVAIPSRFAVDHLFVRKLMKQAGLINRDLELIEMNPPDMPAALYAGAVEAYATGEPFGAVAEKAGYARPLYMTRDIWPNYICCVLTVREELIQNNRPLVQRLVNHVMSAGEWLDASPANREQAIQIAAKPEFFNQEVEVLRFVMQNPSDRVTYGNLGIIRAEFEELMQLALEAGMITRPIPYEKYVDESFFRNAQTVRIALKK
jgi:NitT/TauT family transport system substrate-binding protein